MDQALVLEQLLELHREIELDAGHDLSTVTDDVQPIDELAGFDSPLIPTVVRQLAKKMGVYLPKGTRLRNPYLDTAGKKLTLRGVAARFCQLYGKEKKR